MNVPSAYLNKMYQEHPALWMTEVYVNRDYRRIDEYVLLGSAKPWNMRGTSLMTTFMSLRLLTRINAVPSESAALMFFDEYKSEYDSDAFAGVDEYVKDKLLALLCGTPIVVSVSDSVMLAADILLLAFFASKVSEDDYTEVVNEGLVFAQKDEFLEFLEEKGGLFGAWLIKRFLGSIVLAWGGWQQQIVEIVCNQAFGELPPDKFVAPAGKFLGGLFPPASEVRQEKLFFDVVESVEEKIGAEKVSYPQICSMFALLDWAVLGENLNPLDEVGANDESLVYWTTALTASILEDFYTKEKSLNPDVVVAHIEELSILE